MDRDFGEPVQDGGVRPVIARSWRRSHRAGVNVQQRQARCALSADEAAARWAAHPLADAEPLLREVFREVVDDGRQMVIVCDRDGVLLWRHARGPALAIGEALNAVPGSDWSEAAAGTNAMGTALAEARSLQVCSAEHYAVPARRLVGSAAPVHDARNGAMIGVVALAGPASRAHPHSLALVTAAVRIVELQARATTAATVDEPETRLHLLRGDHPVIAGEFGVQPLSLRHAELLLLLEARPAGWTAEQLTVELHGDHGKAVSVRAEFTRLRRRYGEIVHTRPYRLARNVRTDLDEAEALLRRGAVVAALDLYQGSLLTRSEVPLIDELRRGFDHRLREAVLDSAEPAVLERWLATAEGRGDVAAHRLL